MASEFSTNQRGIPIDDITVLCYTKRLERSGVVYGWGDGSLGQLTVRNGRQTLPRERRKFKTVTDIAAGYFTSFAVKDNELFAVGSNSSGQLGLGNGQPNTVFVPAKVDLSSIKNFTSGERCSFAVDKSGGLWSWGANLNGILGRNHHSLVDGSPQFIDSLQNYEIKQVACGSVHVCCLSSGGEVFTWGNRNLVGQEHLDSDVRVPTKVNIEKISQISCGKMHTLLLSADQKTVWAFGCNSHGQLGHGRRLRFAETPVKVPFSGEKDIVKIQCCFDDSAILSADGEITVWGETWNRDNPRSPRLVNLRQVVDISMGRGFMLALTSSNRLYAFGHNCSGQCGQGSTGRFIEEPVEVKNLHNVRIKQISAGTCHCLVKCAKL